MSRRAPGEQVLRFLFIQDVSASMSPRSWRCEQFLEGWCHADFVNRRTGAQP
jgi:hypothetical protein